VNVRIPPTLAATIKQDSIEHMIAEHAQRVKQRVVQAQIEAALAACAEIAERCETGREAAEKIRSIEVTP
jgi:hypothetical protein